MRSAPSVQPGGIERKPVAVWNLDLVLITRLFGGGPRTRELDPISLVRSGAAKSAVRAWWRAGNAHQFQDLQTLRKRESELFGSPGNYDRQGRLQGGPGALEVTFQPGQQSRRTGVYAEPASSPLNLALFPAEEMGGERATLALPGEHNLGTLSVLLRNGKPESFEGDSAAILEGLRLWVTLGGVGSRTRRGVGAIGPKSSEAAEKLGLPTSLQELKTFLASRCERHGVSPALDGVFSLARTRKVFLGRSYGSGEAAQEALLKALKEARQSKDPRWPEANAIRWKFDPVQAAKREKPERDKNRYPRMVLGLPIVFHFKDSKYPEPPDHHLYTTTGSGEDRRKFDRYSSPIVLRPVRVWEKGRASYIPVAIFTDCLLPDTARPLVVTDADVKAEDIDPNDIIESFEPAREADTVLSQVEAVFANKGFSRLL